MVTEEIRQQRQKQGLELREFRKHLGLDAWDLSRAFGLPETSEGSTVRHWERGAKPIPGPVLTLVELAKKQPPVAQWLQERARRAPNGSMRAS